MTAGRAWLVGCLTRTPSASELAGLSGAADALEVRADLGVEADPRALRSGYDGELIFTLRSRSEGGRSEETPTGRLRRLAAAAAHWDLVDLEAARDLEPELLAQVPPERRIVSWHGPPRELEELLELFSAMQSCPARYYKLVPEARDSRQAIAPLALLGSLGRRDVIAFASGAAGTWTRLLAPRLGAPVVYAAVGEAAAPGQLPLERLRSDFGLPDLPAADRVCGIVGSPVSESLSPLLHNRLYREQGIGALYLPFEVGIFGDFWLDLVESGSLEALGYPLGGLSVTAPFKEIAQAVAGASSPLAERIGAANTLVEREGVWEAETTDPEGVVGPLAARGVRLAARSAVVVGAGGAGRAAAFGLALAGARVTLANRGIERGSRVAAELGLRFVPFAELDPGGFDLLVNATPLGRTAADELPLDPSRMKPDAVLVDLAYRRGRPTRLVEEARGTGRRAVDGREVLLHQAVPQYRLMTGREMPFERARELLELDGEPGG